MNQIIFHRVATLRCRRRRHDCELTGSNHGTIVENMNRENEGEIIAFQKTTKMPSSKVFIQVFIHKLCHLSQWPTTEDWFHWQLQQGNMCAYVFICMQKSTGALQRKRQLLLSANLYPQGELNRTFSSFSP